MDYCSLLYFFYFLALFYWLRSPVQYWIKVVRVAILAWFLILDGKLSLSRLSVTLAGGFPQICLIRTRIFIYILKSLRIVISNGCWIFFQIFSYIFNMFLLFLYLLCQYGELHCFIFHVYNQTCNRGTNSQCDVQYYIFYTLLALIWLNLLKHSASMLRRDIGSVDFVSL